MAEDFRQTLYTVDKDGRRKWVYTTYVPGKFWVPRKIVAYLLLAFYLLMPWITIGGKQGILLDFTSRRFIFFGVEFWATDTFFLFLLFGILTFSLFFFTALFGRVWCGWACPETVFLEFVFRPIERLIEGNHTQRKRLDSQPWNLEKVRKKLLKHFLCAVISWIIASTLLAYFIGREPLLSMMNDWPHKNPGPFAMTFVLMGLMAFQFGWFREQFCTVLCPYARFQSVLMDSNSVLVGYDIVRGEPRGKVKDSASGSDKIGDCVDCELCVRVCPTGIDIRNGVQLECIACTACVDACDSIMEKVGRAKGLIRYDTESVLLGRDKVRRLLRPRPVIYGLILCGFITMFFYTLATRSLVEFQVLRGALDKPYSILADGRVSNHFHLRVSNKSSNEESYELVRPGEVELEVITPLEPFTVKNGQTATVPVFFNFSKSLLHGGKKKTTLGIRGSHDADFLSEEITLLGPDD